MSDNPIIPYSMQITSAIIAQNYEKASRIAATAIGAAAEQIIRIANGFDPSDQPFVVTAMKLLSASMYGSFNDAGKNIVDSMMENTTCISVDASALKELLGDGRDQEQ